MWIVECSNPALNHGRPFPVWQSDLHVAAGENASQAAAEVLRNCVEADTRPGVQYRLKYVKSK